MFRRAPKPPTVELPNGCKGQAQIVVTLSIKDPYSGISDHNNLATTYFACAGLGTESMVVSQESVNDPTLSKAYLKQHAGLAKLTIAAMCGNCPISPLCNAPDDASTLGGARRGES